MAGLIFLYDTENYLYLHLSYDEEIGKCITLLKAENKKYEYLTDYIPLETGRDIILGLTVRTQTSQNRHIFQNRLNPDSRFLS